MKTDLIPVFLSNPSLQQTLQQLIKEFSIEAIFYKDSVETDRGAAVLIFTERPEDAATIRTRKWVRNSSTQTPLLIHVQSFTELTRASKAGNPFWVYHLHCSHLLYGKLKDDFTLLQKSTFKKFGTFKKSFYHDHDLLLSQAQYCDSHESVRGSFLNYISVYEYDFDYLETLYVGSKNFEQNLHERLHQLIPYLPVLEQLFVKKDGKTFYLIDVLEKAKTIDDEYLLNRELYPSIRETEAQLYELISARFREMKIRMKQPKEIQSILELPEAPLERMLLDALTTAKEMAKPEEIYHYHTKIREKKITFYLLLIGEHLGTDLLDRIQQSVSDRTENRCHLVFLGHSRMGIQKDIYLWQGFFKTIMTEDQKVYASTPHHPAIHWEEPYTAYYPDLDVYYRAAQQSAEQFMLLKNHHAEDNYEGFNHIFATSFSRILRVYIFRSLCYMPTYLSPEILWKLCTYAKPELEQLEYLFDKVSKDRFFLTLHHYLKFNDHLTYGSEEKLLILEEILLKLMKETEFLIQQE